MADKNVEYKRFLEARGIETPCRRCSGLGVIGYGSTATWHGGIGGQMMTNDVCCKCWGSGDEHRPWTSWREVKALIEENRRLKAQLKAITKEGG